MTLAVPLGNAYIEILLYLHKHKTKITMSTAPIKINDSLFCLANDWKKGEHRYSLELSKTEDPKNTILVVGVNPGGKTDPEEKYIGRTIRRVCDLVIYNGEGDTKYDSALFVNLTPKIAITPSGLKDSKELQVPPRDNVEEIKTLIRKRKNHISNVLFCFGNSFKYGKDNGSFTKVIDVIKEELPLPESKYWCLGISKKGYPIHPLARTKDKRLTECSINQDFTFSVKD